MIEDEGWALGLEQILLSGLFSENEVTSEMLALALNEERTGSEETAINGASSWTSDSSIKLEGKYLTKNNGLGPGSFGLKFATAQLS